MPVSALNRIDHIALPTNDIAASVAWYEDRFGCRVAYQDATWALLEFENVRLALVLPEQHPAHVAFVSQHAAAFGRLKTHRDGTRSTYITDPHGNALEVMDERSLHAANTTPQHT